MKKILSLLLVAAACASASMIGLDALGEEQTLGGECECQNGTHIWEDLFYPEIIDPVTLQPVEPGQKGELVFTTLDKWGMPMIRYRTRDLTSLNYDICDCGRTCVRMGKILGRSDDMMIIRGVNVFPSQIESILLEFPEYEPYFLIEVDRVNNTDDIYTINKNNSSKL